MFRKLLAATVLAGVLVMSGCASVPMASKSADAQAKQFTPVPDKATVYIYRNEVFGSAIKMPLLIDNMSVGDTASKTYVAKELPPGSHTITSKTEKDSSVTIDMVAGQLYYVWQEVKMGMFAAGSALHVVDEKKGRAGVQESTLIE
jgi:PBP1b-binding outer membrane lipoprotein LpoB